MITSIFKPKWQHENPEIRAKAVAALSDQADQAILLELARVDPSPEVQRLALAKIHDPAAVLSMLEDAPRREPFQLRLVQLLVDTHPSDGELPAYLDALQHVTVAETLIQLAEQGIHPEIRLAALDRIDDETCCVRIALHDAVVRNRLRAVEKIHQADALENVVQASRGKDKRIHREASDKLAALREAEEKPRQLRALREALCQRLEKIRHAEDWDRARKEYVLVEQQWQELAKQAMGADGDLFERFTQNYQQFKESEAQYQEQQAHLEQLREQRQALLDTLEQRLETLCAASPELDLDEIEPFLAAQEPAWRAMESLPPPQQNPLNQRFAQLTEQIHGALRHTRKIRQAVKDGEHLLKDMRRLLEGGRPVREKNLEQFQHRWDGRDASLSDPALADLHGQFHDLLGQLRHARDEQKSQQKSARQDLSTVLDQLEATLESGELHEAVPLEKQAQELFACLEGLPHGQIHALEQRLHQIDAKYRELCSWQQWGNDLEREKLCAEMEAMIGQDIAPETLARQIQEAQKRWKDLSHLAGDRSNQALWKRFQTACNQAYEPCKQHFSRLAEERKGHYEQKIAVCEAIETFIQQTPWDGEVDWKAAHRFLQEQLKAWHAIGPVDRKEKKNINRRFDTAMAELDKQLEVERGRNQRQRKKLIENALGLNEEKDIRKAIDQAKRLQAEWKITVPGTRREEKDLWEAFRGACDQVFQRRKDEQDAFSQELQTNLDAKTQLCVELETLAASDDPEVIKTFPARRAKAQENWRAIGQVPKKNQRAIDQRFEDARAALHAALNRHKNQQARRALEALRAKAELCAELERAIQQADPAESLAQATQAWVALPPLSDSASEKAIQARFDSARAAAEAGQWPAEVLDAGQRERELLCIQLELAAGVESPPEARQARMEYQVQRLSQAMTGDKPTDTDPQALERAWYFAGPCRDLAPLEQRIQSALAAFQTNPENGDGS